MSSMRIERWATISRGSFVALASLVIVAAQTAQIQAQADESLHRLLPSGIASTSASAPRPGSSLVPPSTATAGAEGADAAVPPDLGAILANELDSSSVDEGFSVEPASSLAAYNRPGIALGLRDAAIESIFGSASKDEWRPLSLATFFSEGWDAPFHATPIGPNGAPKQNWIGAPAGIFGRFATLDFFYTNHLNNVPANFLAANHPFLPVHPPTDGNQYAGYTTVVLPISARFGIIFGTVFIAANRSSPGGDSSAGGETPASRPAFS